MILIFVIMACNSQGSFYYYEQSSSLSASQIDEGSFKESFPAAVALYSCRLYDSCGLLQGYGGDMEACYDAVYSWNEEYINNDCNWNEQAAFECLSYVQATTCEELQNDAETSCGLICGYTWE